MKSRIHWVAIGLAAICAGWTANASELITWWGPLPPDLQAEPAAVGETTLVVTTADISPERMAAIVDAVTHAPPPPVGEAGTSNLYLHVCPAGAVGPSRIIYVPVSGPGSGRIAVTRRHVSHHLSPVGERVPKVRVIYIQRVSPEPTPQISNFSDGFEQ